MIRLSNKIELYKIDNFLSLEECDALINLGEPGLEKSTCYKKGLHVKNVGRTSKTSFFHGKLNNAIMNTINKRIGKVCGQNLDHSESLQMQCYHVGDEFKAHYDTFEEGEQEDQRTWTVMVYLNDVKEGGGTNFTKLNLRIRPKKGTAVIWNNLRNGKRDPLTIHAGEPVIKGKKYIINKWFREKPRMTVRSKVNTVFILLMMTMAIMITFLLTVYKL